MAIALKETVNITQEVVFKTAQKQEFSKFWKKANVILIRANTEQVGTLKMRSVCLLDVAGKLFERRI